MVPKDLSIHHPFGLFIEFKRNVYTFAVAVLIDGWQAREDGKDRLRH